MATAESEKLRVKPEPLAERIDAALSAPDPRRALLDMKARVWLAEGAELLRQ